MRPSILFNKKLGTACRIRAAAMAVGLTLIAVETSRAERLIGVTRFTGELIDIDPPTGAELKRLSVTPPALCKVVQDDENKVFSMTRDRVTGEIYGIVRGNLLVTIDPATGTMTYKSSIAGLSHITSITFISGNRLYAIVGGAGSAAGAHGTIHEINPVTGAATLKGFVTSGAGGHALEYNSIDGFLYHFYSSGGFGSNPDGLEKLDPFTGASTPIPLSGSGFGAINGLVYASGNFYAYDNVNENVLLITPGGNVSIVSNPGLTIQALEWESPNLIAVDNENKTIFEMNPGTTAQSNVKTFLVAPCPPSLYSIARDPVTEIYYVITDSDDPDPDHADTLWEIDIDTGLLSNKVPLTGNQISGITIGMDSQIYGVIGNNHAFLSGGTIVTIDKVTGAVTDTTWTSNQTGGGHSLEYGPDHSELYHFFDDTVAGPGSRVEKIDPATGNVTPVNKVIPINARSINGVVYRGQGLFYAIDNAGRNNDNLYPLYRIDTAAQSVALGVLTTTTSGLELAPDPPVVVPPNAGNPTARKLLQKRIKKLRKAIKRAKMRKQNRKVRTLKRKLRKLLRRLRAL